MSNPNLQEEFIAFRNLCADLQNCFNTFQHLYDSPERKAVLERSAPLFFGDLHFILQEYFFLQVRRLTDGAETKIRGGVRENLTFCYINKNLEILGLMTKEISALSVSILSYRDLTAELSNRVVAHADKHTMLGAKVVGAHSDGELERFMSDVRTYTDAVGTVLGVGPLDYRVQAGPGDVVDLIRVLRRGMPEPPR